MNTVSRKSLDWHPYKSAGHPCSLACLIVIPVCLLLDVTRKEHKWRNGFFRLSWKATSICTEDVKYADNVQQYFWLENNKGLTVHYELEWSASSCSWSWISTEMLPLEWSDADEEVSTLSTAYIVRVYYISCIFNFTAHWKEVGGFWYLYNQGMRPPHLFC
jgi:hypothetical protein